MAGGSSAVLPLSAETEITGESIPLRAARFEAQQFDSAWNAQIGYARSLRMHYVKVTGWSGTVCYDGVPLCGGKTLQLTAASLMQTGNITAEVCGHKLECSITPSDRFDDFAVYRIPLPDGLPDAGRLVISMQSGVQLLDIAILDA